MSNSVVESEKDKSYDYAKVMELVLMAGDLSKLSPADRIKYYRAVCESLGLNPLTRPFEYIVLNGKLTLYTKKDATDQLRCLHKVSITETKREKIGDLFIVTAKAKMPDGRMDEDIGAVSIANLKHDVLANVTMKAQTKAKRRVTLSICGLGFTDESELEAIPNARLVPAEIVEKEPELTGAVEESPRKITSTAPPPPADGISLPQRKLLFATATSHGWSEDDIKSHIKHAFDFDSTKQLNNNKLQIVLKFIEANPKEVPPAQKLVDTIQAEAMPWEK